MLCHIYVSNWCFYIGLSFSFFTLLVRIPGWKVNENCGKSSDGNTMKCFKYDMNASVASNVNCVAMCEAEKARSGLLVRQLRSESLVRIA